MLSSLACSLVLSVGFRLLGVVIFFFKQKTAYEMRISDWSSDVCSSDLFGLARRFAPRHKPDRSGEGVALMDGSATDRGEARLFAGIELGGTKCICTLAAGPDDVRDQQTIATTVPSETMPAIMAVLEGWARSPGFCSLGVDRKSTRLKSSH